MLIWFLFKDLGTLLYIWSPPVYYSELTGIIMKVGELDPIWKSCSKCGLTPGKCASLFIHPLPPSVCQHHSDEFSSFIHRHAAISVPRTSDCKSKLDCTAHLNIVNSRSYPKHYIIDYALTQEYKYNDCPPLKSRCILEQLDTHRTTHTVSQILLNLQWKHANFAARNSQHFRNYKKAPVYWILSMLMFMLM